MPRASQAREGRAELPPVQAPQGQRSLRRVVAIAAILQQAEDTGEGFRVGVLGIPRRGKTSFLRELVDEALARGLVQLALVHDAKYPGRPQYSSTARVTADDFRQRPPGPDDSPIVCFNPATYQGPVEPEERRPSVEEVAELGLELGQRGLRVLVLADELRHGVREDSQRWITRTLPYLVREGSSQGISTAWTTQDAAALPREARTMQEHLVFFQLTGGAADYVVDQWRLPRDLLPVISSLQTGEFIVYSIYTGWDGFVYGPG